MTTLPRTAQTSEHLRLLAMLRLADGWSQRFVADFLGVSVRSVRRWRRSFRRDGEAGLSTRPRSGRPPKLSDVQCEQVLSWLDGSSRDFGFATERWTAPRVAWLIERELGVHLHPRYLNQWLRRRGITPQMPQRQPRERDDALVEAWVRQRWPRIKKRRVSCTGRWCLRTKAGSCSRH